MKKYLLAMMALVMVASLGATAQAANVTNYPNNAYATQIATDTFGYSVKRRFESARGGETVRGLASAPLIGSSDAYGMAPVSRVSGDGYSRRQLDCVYYNGFTIWADAAAAWAGQSSDGDDIGYKYRTMGPVIGFDWSNGAWTFGAAGTYLWGKQDSKWPVDQNQDANTFGGELYGQYNTRLFYANVTAAYANTKFKGPWNDSFHSNSFNFAGEFGFKFNLGCFRITPNIGLRYFHDRRGETTAWETGYQYTGDFLDVDAESYHVLELPIGVNLAYEFVVGGAVLIPQLKFAWIPELDRNRGYAKGTYYEYDIPTNTYDAYGWDEFAPTRNRHGFLLGAGLEAKITKTISAHIDYNCNLRSRAYEHHLNLGVGFTF